MVITLLQYIVHVLQYIMHMILLKLFKFGSVMVLKTQHANEFKVLLHKYTVFMC